MAHILICSNVNYRQSRPVSQLERLILHLLNLVSFANRFQQTQKTSETSEISETLETAQNRSANGRIGGGFTNPGFHQKPELGTSSKIRKVSNFALCICWYASADTIPTNRFPPVPKGPENKRTASEPAARRQFKRTRRFSPILNIELAGAVQETRNDNRGLTQTIKHALAFLPLPGWMLSRDEAEMQWAEQALAGEIGLLSSSGVSVSLC